jgi:uncharacterized protein (TIGR02118 family)
VGYIRTSWAHKGTHAATPLLRNSQIPSLIHNKPSQYISEDDLLRIHACSYKTSIIATMSGKGAAVIVLYPRKEGSTFDLDYYHATHMPLVTKHWKKHGLKSFTVTKLGDENPYSVSATMDWESSESIGKALADPETKAVMEDIKNFSSEQPILLSGEVTLRG